MISKNEDAWSLEYGCMLRMNKEEMV